MRNDGTVSQGLAWRVNSKMSWRIRKDPQHLVCWLKMAWRGRIGRLDWSGGTDGGRVVPADRRLRAGGRNGSATIGS